MKLQAEIGDDKFEIEIERDGDRIEASIGGRRYELEASEPEPNVFLLKHKGRIHEVYVSPNAAADQPTRVSTRGQDLDIRLIDPKRLRGSGSGDEHAGGAVEVKTAMPGKVVRILVESGTSVAKGDGVIVVEAMKMQNELKAPKAGTVTSIKVDEGSTVAAGDVLLLVE